MSFRGRERRAHPRWPWVRSVEMRLEGEWRTCTSMNISYGGVFLSSEDPPALGAVVDLKITLENGDELVLSGMVVRCTTDGGAGIGFVDVSAEAEEALRRIMDALERDGTPD